MPDFPGAGRAIIVCMNDYHNEVCMKLTKMGAVIIVIFTACIMLTCNSNPVDEPEPWRPPVVILPETTKDLNDRGGQTVAQIVESFNDQSALDTNVSPVDNIHNMSEQYLYEYMIGFDISSLHMIDTIGHKYYDNDGYRVVEFMELLTYYGVNWVRVRQWNEPWTTMEEPYGQSYGGGSNDLNTAMEIMKRAKQWGIKYMHNFHYSDFWAHPNQQARPKAWLEYGEDADLVAQALYEWTKEQLYTMANETGYLPDMVQIGNETNAGFCGFFDRLTILETKPNERKLLAAGLRAIKEISEEYNFPILRMLHAAISNDEMENYFRRMDGLDYDIIGISYYPSEQGPEATGYGGREMFQECLQNLADIFKKPIILAEYSPRSMGSPNDKERSFFDGTDTSSGAHSILRQAQTIRNFNSDVMNYTVSDGVRYGIGSIWWEPAWLGGFSYRSEASREWYMADFPGKPAHTSFIGATAGDGTPTFGNRNTLIFSGSGTVLPSMNAFLQMMGKPARAAPEWD